MNEEPKNNSRRCCLLIPALNPSTSLLTLIADLIDLGLTDILVINDGSNDEYASTFEAAKRIGAIVIEHPRNLGKGAALKTGFKYCLDNRFEYVITLDADGQHLSKDTLLVVESATAQETPSMVLGVRYFAGDVPLRSRFGNELTQWIFWKISGVKVRDTQTGLRAFHYSILPGLIELSGDRYEYEMNVLMHIANIKCPIIEVNIDTVYLDGNSSSHFRPLVDSMRIYSILFRDAFLALSSFGIDIALFNLVLTLSSSISIATYTARIVSGSYNFLGNKFFVFRKFDSRLMQREALNYIVLAIALAVASSNLVSFLLLSTNLNPTLCKIMVDLSLYVCSLIIRKTFIFK